MPVHHISLVFQISTEATVMSLKYLCMVPFPFFILFIFFYFLFIFFILFSLLYLNSTYWDGFPVIVIQGAFSAASRSTVLLYVLHFLL